MLGFLRKYGSTILIGVITALLILLIINFQIGFFKYSLFIRTNPLRLDELLRESILLKVVISVSLMVLGVCCLFLFHFSYEDHVFMELTRVFFYSAAVVYTLFETETLFYTSTFNSRIWIKSGNIAVVLFASAVIITLIYNSNIKITRYSTPIAYLISIIFSIATIITSEPTIYNDYLKCFFFISFIYVLIYLFFLVKEKKFKKIVFPISICILLEYVIYLVSWHKLNLPGPWILSYTNAPYVILAICLLLFGVILKKYRTNITYDHEDGLKVMEVKNLKKQLTGLVQKYYNMPLNTLMDLCSMLAKEDIEESNKYRIIEDILFQADNIRKGIYEINQYTLLNGNSLHMDMVRISMYTVMQSALLMMEPLNTVEKANHIMTMHDAGYVLGDPYRLVQVNRQLLTIVRTLNPVSVINITIEKNNNKVWVRIETKLKDLRPKYIRRIEKIIRSGRISDSNAFNFDVELAIISHIIKIHEGDIYFEAAKEKNAVEIGYSLPTYKIHEISQAVSEDVKTVMPLKEGMQQIVVISSIKEQAEKLKLYLSSEDYKVSVYNNGVEAINSIKDDNGLYLVVIGAMFSDLSEYDMCLMIRKRYSLRQLPILLIRKDNAMGYADNLLDLVNDYIFEPLVRKYLLQRIESIFLLQESIRHERLIMLDFLQYQMKPHFIFNTISSIMQLCVCDPKKAYNLLEDFSEYLRGYLFTGGLHSKVSLKWEIDLIKAYLSIEKARFDDRIKYNVNINCNMEYEIYPLLIEPIVENCVKHGMNDMEPIIISVFISCVDKYMHVEVIDNGVGISEELLENIKQNDYSQSVGLSNLKKRLWVYYGESLLIESTKGKGTTVRYKIPIAKKESDK